MSAKYSASREMGREHIPLYPKNFIVLRYVQLALAVIILGLTGFGLAVVLADALILILVVGIFTLISTIYYIVSEHATPNLYNYWAVLSLDLFLLIMWLAAFALLASGVAGLFAVTTYYDPSSGSYVTSDNLTRTGQIFASCMAAAAGLGGVEFALFITSLCIHSVMVHRHRSAGLHCSPGEAPTRLVTKQEYSPAPVYSPQQQRQEVYNQTQYAHQQQVPYTPPAQQQQHHHSPLTSQPTGASYVQPQANPHAHEVAGGQTAPYQYQQV